MPSVLRHYVNDIFEVHDATQINHSSVSNLMSSLTVEHGIFHSILLATINIFITFKDLEPMKVLPKTSMAT